MNYLVVDNYLLEKACRYGWKQLVLYNSVVPRYLFLLITTYPHYSFFGSFFLKWVMNEVYSPSVCLPPITQIEEACKADALFTVIGIEQAKDEYGQLTTFFDDARTMAISYGMQAEINLKGDSLLVKFLKP